MGMEMKRARSELPKIKQKIEKLGQIVMISTVPVFHPDVHKEEVFWKIIYVQVSGGIDDSFCEAEDHFMRPKFQNIFKVGKLKTIEESISKFEESSMRVEVTGEIASIKIEMNDLGARFDEMTFETNTNKGSIAEIQEKAGRLPLQLPARPKFTLYFIGRLEELTNLKNELEKYCAAAIMSYRGVGENRLAVLFS